MIELVLVLSQLCSWAVIVHLYRRERAALAQARRECAERAAWAENAQELAIVAADLEATLERMSAGLDVRAGELQALLDQTGGRLAEQPAASMTAAPPGARRYAEVARLASSGMATDEIARQTGFGREEVRLALSLN